MRRSSQHQVQSPLRRLHRCCGRTFAATSEIRLPPCGWSQRRARRFRADHGTRTYQEGYRPLGIDRALCLLVSKPTPLGSCLWGFTCLHQDFTDSELELSAKLQPILRLLEAAYGGQRDTIRRGRAEEYSLTAREQEVMNLLSRGLTAVAIGHLLGISPRTVAKHLEHVYTKLDVSNRIDAMNRLKRV